VTITIYTSHKTEAIPSSELATRLATQDSGVIWLDITGPNDEDIQIMRDVFHFHPLAIEDTHNARQRPKVEEFPDNLFFVLNPVRCHDHTVEFCELDAFVGHNYVVTVHEGDEPVIHEVQRRAERGGALLPISPSFLLYLLIDSVVDSYFPVLDNLEEAIETLGDDVLTDPSQERLNELFQLKKTLLDMWRVVWPQREILNNLRDHEVLLGDSKALQPYLRDISDHLMWIADMVSTFRDTLTSTMDLYMSSVSNRLNRVVNRLTVITVIIGALTVIGGFYGMNFAHTWPPFGSTLGVPFVLTLMGALIGGLLYTFRKLGWY
jgi:magnesium transporter